MDITRRKFLDLFSKGIVALGVNMRATASTPPQVPELQLEFNAHLRMLREVVGGISSYLSKEKPTLPKEGASLFTLIDSVESRRARFAISDDMVDYIMRPVRANQGALIEYVSKASMPAEEKRVVVNLLNNPERLEKVLKYIDKTQMAEFEQLCQERFADETKDLMHDPLQGLLPKDVTVKAYGLNYKQGARDGDITATYRDILGERESVRPIRWELTMKRRVLESKAEYSVRTESFAEYLGKVIDDIKIVTHSAGKVHVFPNYETIKETESLAGSSFSYLLVNAIFNEQMKKQNGIDIFS